MDEAIVLSEEKGVYRIGNAIHRPAKPWSNSMHRFQRHLESAGLPVEHFIETTQDHIDISAFAQGETVHPYKWSDEALYDIGRLTAKLHGSAAGFALKPDDVWQPWYLREIGSQNRICCHGDIAPWNVITKDGFIKVLVDWEFSGPLDPLVELARICWLFPQLVDDDLGKLYDLPSPEKRAAQVRLLCDGYGLPRSERMALIRQIIEVIICETAHEAIDPRIAFSDIGNLWGFAWRSRSLYWIWRNKDVLHKAML